MAVTKVPPIDYTDRDYESAKNAMVRAIPFYTPEWTDHNDSDFGIVLLKLLAAQIDILHFYVDRTAAEAFISTAVKRESIVNLLKLIGYDLRSIVPASADVVFTLDQVLPSDDVLIPMGTKVQTVASENQTPVVFETTSNLTILAGDSEGTVSVEEGESGEEYLGVSTGQVFQPFEVQATIIVEGSFQLYVDEGSGPVLWTQVDSFLDSTSTDEHYVLERDADEKITITFGDNLTGKIPPATSEITSQFKVIQGDRGGAGVYGNVGANTIKIIQDSIFVGGRRVTLSVNNPAQASGGEDRQSIEEARRLGPASLRALDRAVTAEDFKTLTEQFAGVAKASVTQGSGEDACCACNIELYVAPTGGGTLSTVAKQDLLDELDSKKMIGTCIEIKDPNYVEIDIAGVISIFSNVDLGDTRDEVNQVLDDFFSLEGEFADFGTDVYLGNVFAVLENVNGVDHAELSKVTRKPVPVLDVWNGDPAFGEITVGGLVDNETWTVTWLSATTFSVQGSVSGVQTDGTIDVPYTSDNEEVSFLISSGNTDPAIGDYATFITSKLLGSVPMDATEIMEKGTIALTYAVIPTRATGTSCA